MHSIVRKQENYQDILICKNYIVAFQQAVKPINIKISFSHQLSLEIKVIELLIPDIKFDKQYTQYTKACEDIFRKSKEYKQWILYQHSYHILECPFTHITNDIEANKKLIELHHHPYTLYEITDLAIQSILNYIRNINSQMKKMDDIEILSFIPTISIGYILCDLHLKDLVPYVPLTQTFHKLYHNVKKESENINIPDLFELDTQYIINYDKIPNLMGRLNEIQNNGIDFPIFTTI